MLKLDHFEVLTFDCYGTLIDWETGIWEALRPVLAAHQVVLQPEQALELYGALESTAEAGEYQEYKTILRRVLEGFGARLGFTPSTAELDSFSACVKNWPAFPDSPGALQALHRKYKLAIISNVDDDLFTFSEKKLQVKFDWIITARQARSYKPSLNNFRVAFERIGIPPGQDPARRPKPVPRYCPGEAAGAVLCLDQPALRQSRLRSNAPGAGSARPGNTGPAKPGAPGGLVLNG